MRRVCVCSHKNAWGAEQTTARTRAVSLGLGGPGYNGYKGRVRATCVNATAPVPGKARAGHRGGGGWGHLPGEGGVNKGKAAGGAGWAMKCVKE